ncbi:MAG: AAA family ATPase [Spirochaetota bacterium]
MLETVSMKNFGPIRNLQWDNIGKINLLIGGNSTGKTFLLKSMYTLLKTSEEFARGDDRRKFGDILEEKLYWTFQTEKFSDLISKGQTEKLEFSLNATHGNGSFSVGERTNSSITDFQNNFQKREDNSIFIPAKEVLSILKIIKNSREQMKSFGFDDTYYDLAKALDVPVQKGKNYKSFSDARRILEELIEGRIEYQSDSGKWTLKKGRYSHSINIASEGTKKISVLYNLLGNRYLTPDSIIFIDEPESALHPKALNQFIDLLFLLVKEGMQIFIASHSYFTIKKLLLLTQKENIDLPIVSFTNNIIRIDNLREGMPENSIIQESIDLYEQEVEASFAE